MKDVTKKVVILNNFSSPYISEAIIVLKNYNPKLEGHIIDEAECVVREYLNKTEKERRNPTARKKSHRSNKPHITVSAIITAICLAIAGLIYRLIS